MALAIENEAGDSLHVPIELSGQAGICTKERNLHCDVHVAAVDKRTLPPFEFLDSFWIASIENRDEGLYAFIATASGSLATQTAAICVRFQARRVRHMYVTMQITFLTRKSALTYTSERH